MITKPESHYQDLMHRALKNYEFIKEHASDDGPYEVTQLLGVFMCCVAYPRERELEHQLGELTLEDAEAKYGLPRLPILILLNPDTRKTPENVGDLALVLRHAIAHGNIAFERDPKSPDRIGRIKLSNRHNGKEKQNTTVPVELLEEFVYRFVDIADHYFNERMRQYQQAKLVG